MNKKYGIVLSGGKASRLFPITQFGISKQLLPVFNKPMIEFPLRTLQDMGVSDILIINADKDQQKMFKDYLGDGSQYGFRLEYIIQEKPNGIAEAFILGEEFLKDADDVILILGDNSFIGNEDFSHITSNTIFTYKVKNPSAYGVVKLDEKGLIENIIEKPLEFISEDAVTGLYYFSKKAVDIAKNITPSKRGELEIVDVIRQLNILEGVKIHKIESGFWFDCGTHEDLLDCANLVRTIEHRTSKSLGIKKPVANTPKV
jgi:glucose-1-phosphate thymidylyltransferase